MKCVCLICNKPDDMWLQFLSQFKEYDIIVIIDDNSKIYSDVSHNIKLIQIKEEDCITKGFKNLNTIGIEKEISGWDKAIYYFTQINKTYTDVWFFEDDVFFYDEDTLLNLDFKYPICDLLSRKFIVDATGAKDTWLWKKINIKLSPPHYAAMVCCVRLSAKLLEKINEYAIFHNELFFIEALFPTICVHHKFLYNNPDELANIHYQKNYTDSDINKINCYHPVKDKSKHAYYRTILE